MLNYHGVWATRIGQSITYIALPEIVEQRQHRLPDRPTDILEVHVDTVWTSSRQLGGKIGGTVIDRGGEAQCVRHERAFLRAAGNADCPRTCDHGELAD